MSPRRKDQAREDGGNDGNRAYDRHFCDYIINSTEFLGLNTRSNKSNPGECFITFPDTERDVENMPGGGGGGGLPYGRDGDARRKF